MVATASTLLPDDMLARFRERAPQYDQENRFFQEDFDELKASGYLTAAVPTELGGGGLNYAEMMQLQRRLAYHAAPTALAVNMHVYWAGTFADNWRLGDKTVEPFLKEIAAGEVYAAGHAESGNDLPVLLSTTRAERVDGGYKFYGRKSFGSLGPAWTRLGLHAMDTSDPAAPKIVHAFMPRGTDGSSTVNVWDTVGMRATQSDDTVLDGAFVPDDLIVRVIPAGAARLRHGVGKPREADVHRPDAAVEVPRRGAARNRRDVDGAGQHRSEPGLVGGRLGKRRRPRTDVGRANRRAQVPRSRERLEGRRQRARDDGRIRHFQGVRLRTPVARRAPRPNPPGELGAVARVRREDGSGDQP